MSDSDYRPPARTLGDWEKLVSKQLGGAGSDTLCRDTPEGIRLKPLYTAADTADLPFADTMPGLEPFVRGPQGTMYVGRPWTCLLYTSPSPRDRTRSRMPSSA